MEENHIIYHDDQNLQDIEQTSRLKDIYNNYIYAMNKWDHDFIKIGKKVFCEILVLAVYNISFVYTSLSSSSLSARDIHYLHHQRQRQRHYHHHLWYHLILIVAAAAVMTTITTAAAVVVVFKWG